MFEEYINHGWALCRIEPGTKGPRYTGWNEEHNKLLSSAGVKAAGLMHAYSGTCALDLDDLERATKYLQQHGIDVVDLFLDPTMVRIESGRPNRAKFLFSLAEPLVSKSFDNNSFELRCSTSTGKTVQDVLPPSPHPRGTNYKWVGDWRQLPTLPQPLRALWLSVSNGQTAFKDTKTPGGSKIAEITDLLSRRDPNCGYDDWVKIGMAIHHESQGSDEGFTLWDEWSSPSSKYPGSNGLRGHWASFGRSDTPITIDSLRRVDVGTVEEFSVQDPADFTQPEPAKKLRVLNLEELRTIKVPEREYIVEPIIQTSSTTMLYSKRGVGKSYISLGLAKAIAAGDGFMKWKTPKPRKILYVDAEMPLVDVQKKRLPLIFGEASVDPDYFHYLSLDLQDHPLGCISTTQAQKQIEDSIGEAEFLILDNISTLVLRGKENEAESWAPIQEWILALRRKKIAVLLVHHAGRNGEQRGTTKREDILDTVINLLHPRDYLASQGLRAEIHFEKSRGFYGDDAEPIEVSLNADFGACWNWKPLSEVQEAEVKRLSGEGYSVRDISKETGISKTHISRLILQPKGEET